MAEQQWFRQNDKQLGTFVFFGSSNLIDVEFEYIVCIDQRQSGDLVACKLRISASPCYNNCEQAAPR